jgi:hypothetical protein
VEERIAGVGGRRAGVSEKVKGGDWRIDE